MEHKPTKDQPESDQPKVETAMPIAPAFPQNQPTPMAPIAPTPAHGSGLAIAAMVVGICSLVLALVPFLGFGLGVTAVVLGIISLKHKINKGMSIAGLVTGAIATVWSLIISALFIIGIMGLAIFSNGVGGIIENTNNALDKYNAEQQVLINAKKDFAKGSTAIFNKFEIKVNSVQRNYVPDSIYSQADDGKEFIVVNVSAKNIGEDSEYFSSYDLDINDAGTADSSSYLSVAPEFTGDSISAGATNTGNIVYEVNKDSTDLKIQYEETVYSSATTAGFKTLTYTLAI